MVFVVLCLWLCLCVCGCVFEVVSVVVRLWLCLLLCVCGCVCRYVFVIVSCQIVVLYVVVCLWLCAVVEVRQGTLGLRSGSGWSWLRSGREGWAPVVAVEVRQATLAGWSGREHWAWMVEVWRGTLGADGRG